MLRIALLAALFIALPVSNMGQVYACSCIMPGTPSEELATLPWSSPAPPRRYERTSRFWDRPAAGERTDNRRVQGRYSVEGEYRGNNDPRNSPLRRQLWL